MKGLKSILKKLKSGEINSTDAESLIINLIASKGLESSVAHKDVSVFFENNLAEFRKMVKSAGTIGEQDRLLHYCDSISYLKIKWNNSHKEKIIKLYL